jgi:chromosome segregation ATPase
LNNSIAELNETQDSASNATAVALRESQIQDMDAEMRALQSKKDGMDRERDGLYGERQELVRTREHVQLVLGDLRDGQAEFDENRDKMYADLERFTKMIAEKEKEIAQVSPVLEARIEQERELKQQ